MENLWKDEIISMKNTKVNHFIIGRRRLRKPPIFDTFEDKIKILMIQLL